MSGQQLTIKNIRNKNVKNRKQMWQMQKLFWYARQVRQENGRNKVRM